jgi:hypothetical protein
MKQFFGISLLERQIGAQPGNKNAVGPHKNPLHMITVEKGVVKGRNRVYFSRKETPNKVGYAVKSYPASDAKVKRLSKFLSNRSDVVRGYKHKSHQNFLVKGRHPLTFG